jgi:hypothetical protein
LEEESQDQPIRLAQEALVAEEKGSNVAKGRLTTVKTCSHMFLLEVVRERSIG